MAIARWRHEQIQDGLGEMSHDIRGEIVRRISRVPVRWPSGETRRVSMATCYRWIKAFQKGGLAALQPAPRKDKGRKKARISEAVIQKAIAIWSNDPEITFTFLVALLKADPELRLSESESTVSRSTLQRRLAQDPLYARLKRARKRARHRLRYCARRPHEIWHLDAKGPVTIRLISGAKLSFHVLTVLDDASRAALAWLVVLSPDLCAAVRVFRLAVSLWGLPDLIYVDRASIFDACAFREGLADAGVHRIKIRPRNPEANGKIEAYHRVLVSWYTARLKTQQVVDLEHLQKLLDAVIESLYQDHDHRSLKTSPRKALNEQISKRQISSPRLEDAFRQKIRKRTHPKTGEVDFPDGTYIVPEKFRDQRLTFLIDPDPAVPPHFIEPGTGHHLTLVRAAIRPEDRPELEATEPIERWGHGPLQAIYDAWQGKVRPNAEPGFGLPELFDLLAEVTGRQVPRSDAESATIHRIYQEIGPLPKKATEAAIGEIGRALGKNRPISAYLDALKLRVVWNKSSAPKNPRRNSQ
jgi:transposase InsO family protein